nr:LamG-like jellyroll fold domain-containing protein [uncultured Sulfurimonas sp.]
MKTFKKAFYFPLLFLFFFSTNLYSVGLTGTYYNNNSFTTPSAFTRVDSTINFEWGSASPNGAIGNDNYSIEWKGYIYLPENANYIFSLAHDDVMVLNINGVELYNNSTWTGNTNNYQDTASTYYTTGYYPITIKFTEWTGGAYAKFAWKNDSSIGSRVIVPTTNLFTSIVTDFIKAEYRFDECSWSGVAGEVVNSIGVSNGQSYNGAKVDKDDSMLCSSASFDGVDDYISAGDSFNDIFGSSNDKFTITAWIKPKSFNAATSNYGTANTIFAKASDSNNDNLEIGVNSNGSLHVYIDASTDFAGNIGTGITQDNWHFIAVIYDGSTLSTFIDGVKSTNASPNGNFANATGSPFTIGTTLHSDTSFSGLVDEVKIFNIALSDGAVNTIYANESAKKDYLGSTRTCKDCIPSYCEVNGLAEGFHIIDPDGGDDSNSYEIYCDRNSPRAPRELIALPLKNDYNNFVFEDDSPSANYYSEADSAKTTEAANSFNFLQIKISGSTIEVEPTSVAEGSSNQGYFSNINLIGTPFVIDWTNTSLSNCNTSKLRKGAWDQAVKINTLDYTNGRCKVNSMRLKLLSQYKYLTYPDIVGTTNSSTTGTYGSEILEETCRQIFQKVPDDVTHLPTLGGASNGYFWVDPDKSGRVLGDTVTTKFRPFVAYCKYQEDIKQAWTFVMALDAKVTNSKNDIKTMSEVRNNPSIYHDTCSQLGLLFFVPNTKDTFTRTQSYLSSNKNEWINYTGTVREKYQMYTNNTAQEYYKAGEGYNEIWPYGPFGLYYPQNGTSGTWGRGSNTPQGTMSGRCMNSGSVSGALECTDYSAVFPDDGTMGYAGWRTTLMDQVAAGLQGITDGDQWWIADVGAGNYIHNSSANNGTPECSITAPGSNRATNGACDEIYYEPNGNYTQYAWLNFISDSDGNVYHNDDNGAFYSYYDYMCMSWDNYYGFNRYGLTEGPFTVIEHNHPSIDTSGGYPVMAPTDLNITTKIFKEAKDFDILLLSQNRAEIVNDHNVSAGVFLVDINQVESNGLSVNQITDLRYYGQLGETNDFNLDSNPRGVITLSDALSTLGGVYKRLAFQFKYCGYSNSWDSCWNISGSGANTKATCKTGYDSLGNPNSPCQIAESNDFAMRPNNFSIASVNGVLNASTLLVKAEDVRINYIANDFTGSASINYNEAFSNLDTDVNLINTGLNCATSYLNDVNQSSYSFVDGEVSDVYTLSDVGLYSFTISEIPGQEFAIVDASDTSDLQRYITPNSINLNIKPHHFAITTPPININHNNTDNFTYLSNDLTNMAVTLNFRATAQNHLNATTVNYHKDCYAANVGVDITYNITSGDLTLPNPIGDVIYKDFNTTGAIEYRNAASLLGFGVVVPPTQAFTVANSGSADFEIRFNFQRDINASKNPFVVNVSDLNVSDKNTAVHIGTDATHAINVDATMFYGRAQGPKRPITKICHTLPCQTNDTPDRNNPTLIYQVYSDNPALLPAFNNNGTGDTRWFANSWHREGNNDGLIGVISEDAANVDNIAGRSAGVFSFEYYLKYNGGTLPYMATMKNTPSSWLLYNENNASATSNDFEVEFTNAGAWSGKAENDTTTTTKAKGVTNRRIMW